MQSNVSIMLLVKMFRKHDGINVKWLMEEQHIKKEEMAKKKLHKYIQAGYLYPHKGAYAFRLFPKKEK